jgi:hypothetical protein
MRIGPPDPVLAQAVDQPVDQRRQALLQADPAVGVQAPLRGRQRLDVGGPQGDDLDPEARIDRVQLGLQQLGDAGGVAAGAGQAHAHRLVLAVQAMEDQLEPPRPLPLGLQPGAQQGADVAGHPLQVGQGADRLEEGQAVEPRGGGTAEDQGLAGRAQGLVDAHHRAQPEPLGQLGARQGQQLADLEQAQARQLGLGRLVQAQGGHRQGGQQRPWPPGGAIVRSGA